MTSKAWDEMRKAKEDSFFEKKNAEALARLKNKQTEKPRLSPVTGEPMVQEVIHGVVVDRCSTSKGVWLDAGELEQLVEALGKGGEEGRSWLASFIKGIS